MSDTTYETGYMGKTLAYPGQPTLVVAGRVTLPCGCAVWIGWRLDNHEVATAAAPHSDDHVEMMIEYNKQFQESLENPTDRPLVDVVSEYLQKVWDEVGTA